MNQNKFKIGIFGDGPWAQNTILQLIKNHELGIPVVVLRYNNPDKELQRIAHENNIDCLLSENVNSHEFIDKIKEYECDLFLSISFNQILKNSIINLPTNKTINCHAGKLPFYRGRNILNWVLINDEDHFGITVHYVDQGIDTGDIILQKLYSITDQDDYNTLLKKAYKHCPDIIYETVLLIKNGNVNSIPQDSIHPVGFYCGGREEGDEIINWNQTSREIFNFVRAICSPGPKATCYLKDQEVKINKVKTVALAPSYTGIPGQIVGKEKNIPIVKTKDTVLRILEYEGVDKLRIGDRLK